MKNRIRAKSGFTMAELLIVVAIIAVLVAIAIPIFTTQLEKSREGVDEDVIRNAYASAALVVLDGESIDDDAGWSYTYDATDSAITVTAKPVDGNAVAWRQTKNGWQMGNPNIANYTLTTAPKKGAIGSIEFTFSDNGLLTGISGAGWTTKTSTGGTNSGNTGD